MNRKILRPVLLLIALLGALVVGGFIRGKFHVDNDRMSPGNFAVALALFKEDYQTKRIRIFGRGTENSTFVVDDYEFVVLPGSSGSSGDYLNPGKAEMATLVNRMAVMLACKWIAAKDPRGEKLVLHGF